MSDAPAATAAQPVRVAAEDEARANFYALLARLYAAAPDAALLAALAAADALPVQAAGAARDLASAWHALTLASAATDAAATADEYQRLFEGVGKSEVSLHASGYLTGTGTNPLAELRTVLRQLDLGRQDGVNVYEDHLAAICETMRILVAGAPGIDARSVAQQRAFFAIYVSPWVSECCNAISNSPIANYYRRVAEFTNSFVVIERDSFAIE